ncbi:RmlC-like cupin domain protein [Acididesulfobacillus acetoxydans]|uniref:RmlC-like cupin domain n=1 Tax=Acididesulfobacillus acetoxydans TaxID=1561005 RepID=A0A8S0X7E6_9FIRM|nr:cupin [Acididesulfobacillus acetoxydans]CAA7603250.1 RmlC-like cupin domain protein [Acididesulfobacillus acetoxydans]CEJ06035.1 RmlC-like cupin domain [Acididesulfobacillus acetoxydans]
MEQKGLHIFEYQGTGVRRVVESGDWFVGIKNYKLANDLRTLETLERHLLSDEVFILLEGECVLVVADATENLTVQATKMERDKVYCVTKGVWHTTILNEQCKLILVENRNTAEENSEILGLSSELIKKIHAAITDKAIGGICAS